jgi:putative flippase GtrA
MTSVAHRRPNAARARWAALVKFGLGGVLSVSIALGTTALLHEVLGVREALAAAGGLVAALTANFFVLRYVVFRGTVVSVPQQVLGYLGSAGVFRGLEYLGFLLLNGLVQIHYLVALTTVLGVSFLLKFFVFEKWIFARGKQDPPR